MVQDLPDQAELRDSPELPGIQESRDPPVVRADRETQVRSVELLVFLKCLLISMFFS